MQYSFKKLPKQGNELRSQKGFILHTRFDILQLSDKIAKLEGVSHSYTFRYHSQIQIGRMFSKKEMKDKISLMLEKHLNNKS